MSVPVEPKATNGQDQDEGLPPRIHLYDYLTVLARYRWLLVSIIVGGTLLVAAYTFVMPQTYPAQATLLPPDKSEGLNLNSFLSAGEGFDLKGLSQNSSAEIFVKILTSRTLADSLIDRLDLMKKLDLDQNNRQIAQMIVQGGFDVSSDRQGTISIGYNASTGYLSTAAERREAAETAATIVNTSIDILDRLNRQKLITRARRTREFIGRMKERKRAERDSAQGRMLLFQQRNNAMALDKQVEASITAIIELQTQIQKKDLEIQVALNDMNPDSKFIANLQSQLTQLKRQRQNMETGRAGSEAFSLALRDVPDLARQYATLKLDLEVATQVYAFLEQQYNQEQVQEARDLPTVSVLDWAQPSMFRSSPRRVAIVAVTFIALLTISLVAVFILDYARKYWRLNDSPKALALRDALRSKRRRQAAGAE